MKMGMMEFRQRINLAFIMFWKMLLMLKSLLVYLLDLPASLLQYIIEWLHFWRLARRFPGPRALPLVGNLLISGYSVSRNKWRLHHKIIFPTYHPHHIATFTSTINKKCDILVKLLRERADGQTFDVKHMIYYLTFDIIAETFMGVPSNQQTHPVSNTFEMIEQGQKTLRHRFLKPWLFPTMIFTFSSWGKQTAEVKKTLRTLASKFVQQRMQIIREQRETRAEGEEVQSGKKKVYGLIDGMLHHMEHGAPISMTDTQDEVITNLIAGFDTAAVSLQLALYALGKNLHVQDKIVEELRTIFGEDGPEEITSETLSRMQYMEMVVKETIRMYPPVWSVLRETGVDTPLASSDLVVPKGSIVVISPRSLHRDPELYPDPEVFDPERFSPEQCARRHPYAYLPFLGGTRACIGKAFGMMEMMIILAKVIWDYEVLPEPSYTPSFKWGATSILENEAWIKIVKRR